MWIPYVLRMRSFTKRCLDYKILDYNILDYNISACKMGKVIAFIAHCERFTLNVALLTARCSQHAAYYPGSYL